MANFRALGIEKEMNECFSSENPENLDKLMKSSLFDNPHITKRTANSRYCTVIVDDCEHDSWWYRNLIGFTFFCEMVIRKDLREKEYVDSFKVVKLTNNKKIVFRCFSPKDVSII